MNILPLKLLNTKGPSKTEKKLAEHFYKFFVLPPDIKYKIKKLREQKRIAWSDGSPPDP